MAELGDITAKFRQRCAVIKKVERSQFIAHVDSTTEQFGQLLEKLDEVVKITRERIDADLARHQAQVELFVNLQRIIKTGAEAKSPVVTVEAPNVTVEAAPVNVDLTPLTSALKNILPATQPKAAARPNYEFTFDRSRHGFVEKILVSAVPASKFGH